VFEDAARNVEGEVGFLVQGTLYPDVIESTSAKGGPSVTIKTPPQRRRPAGQAPWKLIEPLRELFKDEVRQVGRELGLPRRSSGAIRSRGRDSRSALRQRSRTPG